MSQEEIKHQTQVINLKTKPLAKNRRLDQAKRIEADYLPKNYVPYAHNRIKKKWPQYTREDINRALVLYFKLAKQDLTLGSKVNLLNKLGNLYLSKEERTVTYNEETGKILNRFPINVAESLRLWKQKPELRNKTFVRFTNDHSGNYYFQLHFENSKAMFKNKNMYKFKFNRTLKKELVQNIINKKVDAYLLYDPKERIKENKNNNV